MKLHLAQKSSIRSTAPKTHLIKYNDLIIHYSNNNIYFTDYKSLKIIKTIEFHDVQIMKIHQNQLYVCTSDVNIINIGTFEISFTLRSTKALINCIEFYNQQFAISKVNNKIIFYDNFEPNLELYSSSSCDSIFLSDYYRGFLDKENLVIYKDDKKILSRSIENIVKAFAIENSVYTLESTGILKEWISGKECELNVNIERCHISNNKIFVSYGNFISEFNTDGTLIEEHNLTDKIEYFNRNKVNENIFEDELMTMDVFKRVKPNDISLKTDSEDLFGIREDSSNNSIKEDSSNNSKENKEYAESDNEIISTLSTLSEDKIPFIEYFDDTVIKTSNNDYIIHNEFKIYKIICFNEDFSDSVTFNNFLILGTATGAIKYTNINNYSDGDYVFSGRGFQAHLDSIASLSIQNNILLVGSKDKTSSLWEISIENDEILKIDQIYLFDSFLEPITYAAFYNETFVFASFDNVVQIYRKSDSGFDNIFTQSIHSKQVNHILVTEKYIITASSDKTAKILSHQGEILRVVDSDKVLNISSNEKYIAVCSHKAIKIIDQNLNDVATLQSRNPILSSSFFNEFILTVSDVLRVYDINKKKCVKSYDLEIVNGWAFKFPIITAENKIVFLQDQSELINNEIMAEIRQYKEDNLLLDKYRRENRFKEALDILIRKNDFKKMFRVVCEAYYHDGNLDFLDIFSKCRGKLLEMLVKNPGFKQSEIYNLIVEKEVSYSLDPSKKDKILDILSKHFTAIDDLFVELNALDIFE